jgi:hypothetical protein
MNFTGGRGLVAFYHSKSEAKGSGRESKKLISHELA